MGKHSVFILGDSTSMTVGAEPRMFPFLMADEAAWPEGTEFVNCSLPGITAADACAFFFDQLPKNPPPLAVIISVGTCDAMSSEIRKGRYTRRRQADHGLRHAIGIAPKRTKLRNRLLHFEWNSDFNPAIESPEEPDDYSFNIDRVIGACKSKSIPVILVRPKSNPLFPPGVGRGNFIFYTYLGIPARVADRLKHPDERFVLATQLYEQGSYAEAAEAFQKILGDLGAMSSDVEYPLVVVNNYAAAAGRAGRIEEAEVVFQLLLKERGVRKEIVLFNLANLYRDAGRSADYSARLAESYEADDSLYRIRQPYLQALDRLAGQHGKAVRTVDLRGLIDDAGYADHCHAFPDGQRRIADEMLERFREWGIGGESRATIRNVLFSPELAKGNRTEFFTYFRTFSVTPPEEIRASVERIRDRLAQSSPEGEASVLRAAPEEVFSAVEYCRRHPGFPSPRHLLRFGPQYPSDVGRFPELLLVRIVIPFVRVHEADAALANRFDAEVGLLRGSDALTRVLPSSVIPLIPAGIPAVDETVDAAHVEAILVKVRAQLAHHLRAGNQVFERIKSTMFWYFRETLRYGSHSRVSMRYDRTFLEYCAEALAIAGVLDARLGSARTEEILELIDLLEDVAGTHESYASRITLESSPTTILREYDEALLDLAERIEPLVAPVP